MKITNDTQVGNKGNRPLPAGSRSVGHTLGGNIETKVSGNKASNISQKQTSSLGNNKNNKSDISSSRLKKTLSNRRNGIFNLKNRFNKKNKVENNTDTSSGIENSSDTEDNSQNNDMLLAIKRLRRIKIIIGSAIIILPLFLIFIILISILSSLTSFTGAPIASALIDDNKTISKPDSISYQKEKNYYQKLSEIKDKKKKECNDDEFVDYIHSSLIYLYYRIDLSNGKSDELYVDYDKMTEMASKIDELMNNSCNIDYEINGTFYNKLKTNSDYLNYNKELLKEEKIDDVLNNVFTLAKSIHVDDDIDNTVITNDLEVNVTSINTSKTVSMKDYLSGVIYANTSGIDLNNAEKVKALTVLYNTNILANNSLTNNTQTITADNSKDKMLYCDIYAGCSYQRVNGNLVLVSGPGNKNDGNSIYYEGKYYYRAPLSSDMQNKILNAVDSVYGNVLASSDGTYQNIDTSKLTNGSNYTQILNNSYNGYTIKSVKEDVYDNGVNYGSEYVLTKAIFYDQTNYSDVIFCGRTKPKATIKTSGCGVTAVAIIMSTYKNSNNYDPVRMMNDAYKAGYCGYGISGTSTSFFKKEAQDLGYKYLKLGKSKTSDKNMVLEHLRQGKLLIAHMGPGKFTSSGHYIVLGGINPETKEVYVYDPYDTNNKSNSRKSGNGWYSFNDIIVKQAFAFYLIWE